MHIRENPDIRGALSPLPMTILACMDGGIWSPLELSGLASILGTVVAVNHSKHPGYLIILGHYTKDQTVEALGSKSHLVVEQVSCFNDSERLPFNPHF